MIAAGAIWAISVHAPTHWLVGTIVGIRWTDYFLGGSLPPRPGLKSDYGSYLRADPDSRAWMHASGAIATKLAPFAASWPGLGCALVGGGRAGRHRSAADRDRHRSARSPATGRSFRREKAIARERRAALEPGAPRGTGADHRRVAHPAGTPLLSPCRSSGSPVETGPHIAAPVVCRGPGVCRRRDARHPGRREALKRGGDVHGRVLLQPGAPRPTQRSGGLGWRGKTQVLGRVGDDLPGRTVRGVLVDGGVDAALTVDARADGHDARRPRAGERSMVADRGANARLAPEDLPQRSRPAPC